MYTSLDNCTMYSGNVQDTPSIGLAHSTLYTPPREQYSPYGTVNTMLYSGASREGGGSTRTKRGVSLSNDAHDAGFWVGHWASRRSQKGVPMHPAPPPPKPPAKAPKPRAKAPASAPAANDRAGKRQRTPTVPFRVGDNTDGLAHRAQHS